MASLAAFVLITALALVLVLFNPDDYRDNLAAYVARQTGRSVLIEGPVRMSFFPWLGFHIRGVRIAGFKGDDTPLLLAESVAVRVRLWPLLSRKIIMDRVFLHSPQLNLTLNPDNTANWDGLRWGSGDDTVHTPYSSSHAPEDDWFSIDSLSLNGLSVTNGAVVLDDKLDDVFLTFTGIELEAEPGPSFPFALSFAFRNADPPIAADAAFQGTGHLTLSPFSFSFDHARTDLRGTLPFLGSTMPCRLMGTTMFNPVDETMALDNAEFTFRDLDMGAAGTLQGTLSGSGRGEKLFQRAMLYQGAATLASGGLTRTPSPSLVAAANTPPPPPLAMLDTVLASLGGSTRFAVDIKDLRLEDLKAAAPKALAAPFAGRGAVLDFHDPALRLEGATAVFDYDLLRPVQTSAAPTTAPSPPFAWLSPQAVEGWLGDLNVNATLAVGRMTAHGIAATDAQCRFGHRGVGGNHRLEADLAAQTVSKNSTQVVAGLTLALWRETSPGDALFHTPLLQVRGRADSCELGPLLPAPAPRAKSVVPAKARPEAALLPLWLHPNSINAAFGDTAVNATLAAARVTAPAASFSNAQLTVTHQGPTSEGRFAVDASATSLATPKGPFADTLSFSMIHDARATAGPTRIEAEAQAQGGHVAARASLRWLGNGEVDAIAKADLRSADVTKLARTAPFALPPGWVRQATGRANASISLAANGATVAALAASLALQADCALSDLALPVRDVTAFSPSATNTANASSPTLFTFTNADAHLVLRGSAPPTPALSGGTPLFAPYATLCTLSLSRPDAAMLSGPPAGQDVQVPSLTASLQGQVTADALGLSILGVDKAIARARYRGPSTVLGIAAQSLQGPRALPMDIEAQAHPTYSAADGRLDLDEASLRAFGALARGSARVSGLPNAPSAQASLTVPSFVPRATLRALGVTLPDMAAAALQQGAIHATIDMEKDALLIDNLLLGIDKSEFHGSVALHNFAAPEWKVEVSSPAFDADDYLPPKAKGPGAGSMPWPRQLVVGPDGRPLAQPWDIAPLRALRLDGRLRIDKLTLFHMDYEHLDATVKAHDGEIAIKPLIASHYGGTVGGDVRLTAGDTLVCRSNLRAAGFQVEPAMRGFFASEDLVGGTGDVAWNLTSQGLSKDGHLATLSGTAQLTITDGYYKVFGKGKDANAAAPQTAAQTGATANGRQTAGQESPRTQFSSATASFTLQDGTIRNDDFVLNGLLMGAKGSGNASLVSKEFDYTLLMQMTGLPTFPIRFHGTFSDPQVTMRGGQIITDTVGRVGTSIFDLIKGVITTPFKLMEMVIPLPGGDEAPSAEP